MADEAAGPPGGGDGDAAPCCPKGEPLRLLEDGGEADGDRLWVQFPAWMIDLTRHFQQRYGDRADAIVRRVLTELLPVEPRH